jgi:Nucleotidyl transferase AbiEii toxin, Type IV TA system
MPRPRTFDRRIVRQPVLDFIRACQQRIACHLGGGAALAGAYLQHRTTGDIDLFVHDTGEMRALVELLPGVASAQGSVLTLQRDVGYLVRAELQTQDGTRVEVDVVNEPVADIESPSSPVEGIIVESLTDLRASKLACILSRSEPRDLVDLYFLDQAGFPPERDLESALCKDAGIDPGALAWLLAQFPTHPMPSMLKPLTRSELESFRDRLADRMRRSAAG